MRKSIFAIVAVFVFAMSSFTFASSAAETDSYDIVQQDGESVAFVPSVTPIVGERHLSSTSEVTGQHSYNGINHPAFATEECSRDDGPVEVGWLSI